MIPYYRFPWAMDCVVIIQVNNVSTGVKSIIGNWLHLTDTYFYSWVLTSLLTFSRTFDQLEYVRSLILYFLIFSKGHKTHNISWMTISEFVKIGCPVTFLWYMLSFLRHSQIFMIKICIKSVHFVFTSHPNRDAKMVIHATAANYGWHMTPSGSNYHS